MLMKRTRTWLSQALQRLQFQSFVRLSNADFVGDGAEKRAAQEQLKQVKTTRFGSSPTSASLSPSQRRDVAVRSTQVPVRRSFHGKGSGKNGSLVSTYLRVRESQSYSRSVHRSKEFVNALTKIRACEKQLSRCDGPLVATQDGPAGALRHAALAKLSTIIHGMSVEHFSVGATQDLLSILKILLRRPVSGRKFAACACFEQLAARCESLTGPQVVDALLAALVDDVVATQVKSELVANLVQRLTRESLLRDVPFLQLSRLVRNSVAAAPEVLPALVGQSLLVAALRAVAQRDQGSNSTRLSTAEVGQLVPFVRAIAHHRVPNEMALEFLRDAAPIVLAGMYDLSAHELSDVLLAYATIGYRDVEWFVTLGQRAGELGEEMSDDDAGNVVRCFAMIGVDHVALRRSLESSLRMRNLRRKPMWQT